MDDAASHAHGSPGFQRHRPGVAAAADAVSRVRAWYTQQTMAEQRSAAPSATRLEELVAHRSACTRDLDRLDEADPQEIAQIAAHYTALLKELTGEAGPAS
jgi:uncharacterized protein